MKPHATPRVLLVEDDPTSRAFLADVVAQLALVDAVGSGAAALRRIGASPAFDLWLIDAHLPDSDGRSLLAALRLHAPYTPALAHTADPEPAFAARLRAAGFLDVLLKPIPIAVLLAAVASALGVAATVSPSAACRRSRIRRQPCAFSSSPSPGCRAWRTRPRSDSRSHDFSGRPPR